jgi:hypothetical protein
MSLGGIMNSVEALVDELARDRFYGSVEIKFEAGKPVLLRKTETIKPTKEGNRDTRGSNEYND